MKKRKLRKLLDAALGKPKKVGTEIDYHCPFCMKRGADHVGTLHVNLNKNAAICHTCWFGTRNVLNIVRDVLGYTPAALALRRGVVEEAPKVDSSKYVKEVIKRLQGGEDEEKPKIIGLPKEFVRLTLPPASPADHLFYNYLRYRGVTDNEIDDYGLGYCAGGRYGGFLVFPFYMHGMPVYFTTRAVLGPPMKSLNPKAGRRFFLFNYDRAIQYPHIVITEGPLDAIAAGPNAVALTGKSISDAQIRLLDRTTVERITILLDADAERDALKMQDLLNTRLDTEVDVVLLPSGDPAENRERIRESLQPEKDAFASHIAALLG